MESDPDYPNTGLHSKPNPVEEAKIQQEHQMRAELAALREQTPTSTEDCGTPDRSPSGVHESGLVASTEARPTLGRKGVGEGVEAAPKDTNTVTSTPKVTPSTLADCTPDERRSLIAVLAFEAGMLDERARIRRIIEGRRSIVKSEAWWILDGLLAALDEVANDE